MLTISDLINKDEIEKWKPGDIITIQARPGSGKSHFIKNGLYRYAKEHGKRILFLIHRRNTARQFELEIARDKKGDTIDVQLYQFLETKLLHDREVNLSKYSYIVSDESHYFVSDAAFNTATDLALGKILAQNNAIRIFMSGTINDFKDYLNSQVSTSTTDYYLNDGYNHIHSLTFFNDVDLMDEIAKSTIEKGKKAIFFIHSAEGAYTFYKRFKQFSVFNCSYSNSYHKFVDEKLIEEILINERFETPLLITTSTMDAGLNLVDPEIEKIVVDIRDPDVIYQAVGRKRPQSADDTVDLYIHNVGNQALGGLETSLSKKIGMAKYLLTHNTEELLRKYPRQNDASGIIYDFISDGKVVKQVNKLMLLKQERDIETYRQMQSEGEFGFARFMTRRFGFYDEKSGTYAYEFARADSGIISYLSRMESTVMLGLSDRKDFINRVNVRQNGHLLKSADSINAALNEKHIPYRVREFSTSRIIDGKKRNFKSAWRVEHIS